MAPPILMNDLSRQHLATSSEVSAAIDRVVASGWYSLGPEVDAFEVSLARFVGVRHAVGVASGTDALELALSAVGCGVGDEVVTVANAGAYGTVAALRLGCRPRFVDVDPETLLMDAAQLEVATTTRTRAVLLTHLYGRLGPVEEVQAFCNRAGIALVEDCAQAIRAERRGCRAGSFGAAAAFSFYPTKNLGALGDGGAVCTDDDEVATAVRSLRQYGWGERYQITRPGGRNSRLDELQAAVLSAKLPFVPGWINRRREIVRRYREAVAGGSLRMVSTGALDDAAQLAVVVSPERDIVRRLLEEHGIATAIHYPVADDEQTGLARSVERAELPVTRTAVSGVLSLPCYPELTDGEVDRVAEAVLRVSNR